MASEAFILLSSVLEATPERWLPVPGFAGYDVSSCGRIRTYRRKTSKGRSRGGWAYEISNRPVGYLNGRLDKDGYRRVVLVRDGRSCNRGVHKLLLQAFVGIDPVRTIPNHLNNVKHDNRLDNLQWSTISENTLYANEIGVGQRGETHHSARLKITDVLSIRATVFSYKEMVVAARAYGCTVQNIYRIVTRKSWRHV